MKPLLTILVGINYTDSSRNALIQAKRIADQNGAKITACHVVPPGDLTEFVDFYMIEHKSMLNAAKSSLEAFTEDALGKKHEVICQISEGIPHHEIASKANEDGYDLLVIGDQNSAKVAHFVTKCLRFTTMPVLLVMPPKATSGAVAACIDFSESTGAILENINRISCEPIADLDLIHSSRPPWLRSLRLPVRTLINNDRAKQEPYREILQGRLAAVCEHASTILDTRISHVLLEDEDPTTALIGHLSNHDYSLIVVGRNGRGIKGLRSDFLGGTAESILRLAETNVLVVPIKN